MPAILPQSGNIGALLRLIEQERKTAPHTKAPGAEPSAPLRKSVQAPLESPVAPESPGTSRVVSMRPAVTPPTSEAAPPGVVKPGTAIMGGKGGVPQNEVVKPIKYVPPEPAPAAPVPVPGPTPGPAPTAPAPSLATQIRPTAVNPYVKYFGPTLGPTIQEFVEGKQLPMPATPAQAAKPSYNVYQSKTPTRYEKKKTPSIGERLTSYLQPTVDWFRRLF